MSLDKGNSPIDIQLVTRDPTRVEPNRIVNLANRKRCGCLSLIVANRRMSRNIKGSSNYLLSIFLDP